MALATIAAAVTRDNFEIVPARLICSCTVPGHHTERRWRCLTDLGIHRSAWQFTSMRDCLRIVGATVVVVLSAVAIGFLVNRLDGVARALPLIQALLIISFLVGARVLTRVSHDRRVRSAPAPSDRVETSSRDWAEQARRILLAVHCRIPFKSCEDRRSVGEGGRVGRSVHSHPVLGEPEQVVSTLRRLETHGVFVDCILVTMPRNDLSLAVQDALSQIQETTTIRLEYLAERMGIQSPPAPTVVAQAQRRRNQPVPRLQQSVKLWSIVPYRRVKRAIDVVASAATGR